MPRDYSSRAVTAEEFCEVLAKALCQAKPELNLTVAGVYLALLEKAKKKTKAEKKVEKVMSEFGRGKLRSGSKHGPKVTDPKQAIAIAMNQSGQSLKKSAPTITREKWNHLPKDLKHVVVTGVETRTGIVVRDAEGNSILSEVNIVDSGAVAGADTGAYNPGAVSTIPKW